MYVYTLLAVPKTLDIFLIRFKNFAKINSSSNRWPDVLPFLFFFPFFFIKLQVIYQYCNKARCMGSFFLLLLFLYSVYNISLQSYRTILKILKHSKHFFLINPKKQIANILSAFIFFLFNYKILSVSLVLFSLPEVLW